MSHLQTSLCPTQELVISLVLCATKSHILNSTVSFISSVLCATKDPHTDRSVSYTMALCHLPLLCCVLLKSHILNSLYPTQRHCVIYQFRAVCYWPVRSRKSLRCRKLARNTDDVVTNSNWTWYQRRQTVSQQFVSTVAIRVWFSLRSGSASGQNYSNALEEVESYCRQVRLGLAKGKSNVDCHSRNELFTYKHCQTLIGRLHKVPSQKILDISYTWVHQLNCTSQQQQTRINGVNPWTARVQHQQQISPANYSPMLLE